MTEDLFIGYSDAAAHFGTSRQNVAQWLERTGRLAQCEKIAGRTRTLVVLIPRHFLIDAPFAGGTRKPGPGRGHTKNQE